MKIHLKGKWCKYNRRIECNKYPWEEVLKTQGIISLGFYLQAEHDQDTRYI